MAKKKIQLNGEQEPQKPDWRRFISSALYITAFVLLGWYMFHDDAVTTQKKLSYTQLQTYIEKDAIKSVVAYDDNSVKAQVHGKNYVLVFGSQATGEKAGGEISSQIPSVEEFAKYMADVNGKREQQKLSPVDVTYKESRNYWTLILVNVLPFALLILFFVYMSRGMDPAHRPCRR